MKRKNEFFLKRRPTIFRLPPNKYLVIKGTTLGYFFLLFLFLGILFFVFSSDFFKIKFIQCYKEELLCSNQEAELFQGALGKNIFLLNKQKLIKSSKFTNVAIEKIEIKKKLPQRLLIKLKLRKPLAVIMTAKGDFLIDESGFIFNEASQKNYGLPFIDYKLNQPVTVGTKGNELLLKTISLLKILENLYLPFHKITLENELYLLVAAENYNASFATAKDFLDQAVSLQMILQSSKINQKATEGTQQRKKNLKIELQYTKPIITFE